MAKQSITSSSTAEYFSKNLQQVGFSSPTKAVLTTLKESVDNSMDACEEAGILPEITVEIEKKGAGTLKNTDLIRIKVEDNGPGLELDEVTRVFGEYLASSKFGRGRCSRGQQGIGISAATTWAQLTSAKGVQVTSKTARMRQAFSALIEVDIKNNRGILKNKQTITWNKPHGVSVEFYIDGRIQLNGDGGLMTYLLGTTLVNPHLKLKYKVPDQEWITVERVSNECPSVPDATPPHPHTMKLGEFIAHSHLFGKVSLATWLKKGFSRITDNILQDFVKNGLSKKSLDQSIDKLNEKDFKDIFAAIHKTELMAPSTKSVMTIGEVAFSQSVRRLGEVDFFSVVTRRPTICDYKPVAVEVAVARLLNGASKLSGDEDGPVTVLRFANRVPLQFDKAACAIVRAIETVNWRSYGLAQPKDSLPSGPYVVAVSLVSPFIKFKNASKETIDASDELVEEIRRGLIQAGQRLSRHINREAREADLEQKLQHIEQFCPILVDCLCRITKAPEARKQRANEGLIKLLGRDVNVAKKELKEAEKNAKEMQAKGKIQIVKSGDKKSVLDVDVDSPMDPAVPTDVVSVEEIAKKVSKNKSDTKSTGKSAKKGKNERGNDSRAVQKSVPEASDRLGKRKAARP